MGSMVVVIVVPRLEVSISLLGVVPVLSTGPLAQGGLDKALGLAVGSGSVGSGAAVLEEHSLAGVSELLGAVAGTVVGEQSAHTDAVGSEEGHRRAQEGASSFRLLIGQHLSKGHARVVVDGHMQSGEAGMLVLAAQAAIAAQGDLGKACHAFDIQVQQVTRMRVLVTLHGGRRVQIAPAAEVGAAQNAADGGRADATATSDRIAGHVALTQCKNLFHQGGIESEGTSVRARTAVGQPVDASQLVAPHPLGNGLGADAEGGRGRLPRTLLLQYKPG